MRILMSICLVLLSLGCSQKSKELDPSRTLCEPGEDCRPKSAPSATVPLVPLEINVDGKGIFVEGKPVASRWLVGFQDW